MSYNPQDLPGITDLFEIAARQPNGTRRIVLGLPEAIYPIPELELPPPAVTTQTGPMRKRIICPILRRY